MNQGYLLTKAFYAEVETNEAMQIGCKPHHHSLYTWICELRNRTKREVLDLPVLYTMQMSFIGSQHTLAKAIDDLAEWGIIEIIMQTKGQGTKVKLAIAFMQKHCNSDAITVQLDCNYDAIEVQTTKTGKTPENRENREKKEEPLAAEAVEEVPPVEPPTEKPKREKPAREPAQELQFPAYAGEPFHFAWTALCQTPNWRKKTPQQLQFNLNKLAKYDEEFAVQLMNDSAGNGWKGVVFDNTDEKWQEHQSRQAKVKPLHGDHTTYEELLSEEARRERARVQQQGQERLRQFAWNQI
ncbi:hypothetical protein DYU11_20260 [Fibrisoma montanum]|uniref:Uncharacterized protein n=1 Tax=Fibrisoma montanum TaxID=2305895 RepID=A0A418M3I4_9BACT|nr:hypothetical protein [Fibrisoma montanum]RIV20387.1 hypothetical protein DYU11_20260 [Fibrisoma montanum]